MEFLLDPRNNRQVPSVKCPASKPLSPELLWDTLGDNSFLNSHAELEESPRTTKTRGKHLQRRSFKAAHFGDKYAKN